VCYSLSVGTMEVQWAGKTIELKKDSYEKQDDYSINGFKMDRFRVLQYHLQKAKSYQL
jgi:hypothetical protein